MKVTMLPRILRKLTPLAVVACASAQAGTIEYFPPPGNVAFTSLSNAGAVGTSYGETGIYILNEDRSTTTISANSPTHGYGGGPSVSADGRYVAASIDGSDGTSHAGLYDRSTSSWTVLNSLNGAYASVANTIKQSSSVYGISADGSTVVGSSAYSLTPGAKTGTYHGTVWRDGQIYDLTPDTGNGSGKILGSNADGSVVVGYTNNNNRDTSVVWTWNGAGYSVSATPTATNPFTGAANQHVQADAVSANGSWIAGGSSRNLGSKSYGTFGNAITFLQPTLWNSVTNTMTVIPYDHVVDTDLSNDINQTKLKALAQDVDKNAIAAIAGVTDDGTVFGAFTYCIDTHCNISINNQDTFVYSATTGKSVTFDSYVASQGVVLSSTQHVWNLYSVASDGSAVSGYIFDTSSAQTTGFILHITAVPEPGPWALMALGLPLLMLRRRYQEPVGLGIAGQSLLHRFPL